MEHRSLSPDFIVSNDDHVGGNKCTRESTPDVAPQELRKEEQMGGPVNCNDSELSIYLQALAEGYLPTFYSDTSQSAQSKSMSIASKSFRRGKKTVVFRGFPSLKMSRHSTESRGAELLTWFAEASRAKTYQSLETAQELTESAAECGDIWPGSLAKYDPSTSSWKTAQHSLLGGLDEFSETWPRWGLMRNGACLELPTSERPTSGSASGYWPTPNCVGFRSDGELKMLARALSDHAEYRAMSHRAASSKRERYWPTPTVCGNYNRKGASATSGDGLATAVKTWPTATATAYKGWSPNHNRAHTDDRLDYSVEREAFQPGQQTPPMRLNPDWCEWLMGWPIGHTALKPLGTDKFREWQQQHSIY